MNTFVAELSCPLCREPITTVSEDERGVDLPHCCDLYWIPQWKKVNGQLRIYLNYFRPDGIPQPNIIHENEIQESTDPTVTETETSVENTKSTAAMKIKGYLVAVNAEQTAKTADIQKACQLADSSFKYGMDTLKKKGEVEKIGHGLYRLRR